MVDSPKLTLLSFHYLPYHLLQNIIAFNYIITMELFSNYRLNIGQLSEEMFYYLFGPNSCENTNSKKPY